ncbi:sugar phosphate nucleotidyltransferase [Ruegeria arenilitoris]|uniref:sugar phosphate nucleotidyltransferase n=1 Tax=Ruegeria arenilitoris TaxID=1173585 RepID=UPI00147FDED6|nr:sugar phosphate nucleotidyltransferase [Ruegeria arenilitoris]
MKVVLFCGGQGTRLRDYSDQIPKPLVPVGGRPILWHIMKYYASYGHKDFIICLGYKGEAIKQFFLDYDERVNNDFVFENGGAKIDVLQSDIQDWRITFVDTGQNTNIGGRLLRVREHLDGEEMFLANYADTLTDLDLDAMIQGFSATDAVAGFCCVKPPYSFHLVSFGNDSRVAQISDVKDSGMWMNGGYFALRPEIFDNLHEGEELVIEGFERLVGQKRLYAHQHESFWTCMDTFKEKQALDDRVAAGNTPWQVWKDD